MADLRLLLVQTRYALTAAVRNPRVVVFAVVFPIILLVLFNAIFTKGNETTRFAGGRIDAQAYFTAGLLAYAIMLQTFTNLSVTVTAQREAGQLKRLRGTPMPPWAYFAAQVLRALALVTLMAVVLVLIGVVGFNVSLHAAGVLGLAVYAALGTACLATLGIAITALTTTAESASAVGPFAAVILSFVSGVFIPVATLPGWLESIGKVFPLYHLADGLQRAVAHGSGTGIVGDDVFSLVLWLAIGLVVARRRFRWEPQAARG